MFASNLANIRVAIFWKYYLVDASVSISRQLEKWLPFSMDNEAIMGLYGYVTWSMNAFQEFMFGVLLPCAVATIANAAYYTTCARAWTQYQYACYNILPPSQNSFLRFV